MLEVTDITVDYIEDWSTGECIMSHHPGPADCYADRFELCAQKTVPANRAWPFISCNFRDLVGMDNETKETIDSILDVCAIQAGIDFDMLRACASNATSEEWAKTSSTVAAAVGGTEWVKVEGIGWTDDTVGLAKWASSVVSAICTAAHARGLKTPALCA